MLKQVFLSYRHEDDAHRERVRWLADELRGRGFSVAFDAFYLEDNPGGPDESWPRWSIRQAKESAAVLMIGSRGWYQAFSDPASERGLQGCGAASEANVILQQLYQSRFIARRHRIVVLDPADEMDLPAEISGWRRFSPRANRADLEDLVRWAAHLTDPAPSADVDASWPAVPPSLQWPMADHTEVRDAFSGLLTSGAQYRCLLIRGPSESGKSHVTWQMLNNALRMPALCCGRLDFKGTTDVDAALRSFVQYLNVPFPGLNARLNERLAQILDELKRRAKPTLLILDTCEAGDIQDWLERQLLPSLIRSTWLRVVVAGQRVPERTHAVWAAESSPPFELVLPPPEEWLAYGQQRHAELTLDFVRQAHALSKGRPTVLAQLFGSP